MFTITHPHLVNGSAGSNGSLYISKPYLNAGAFKPYGEERDLGNFEDLGIGTSEDSSENSSSKSQRRKAMEDENVKRRYEQGWRKSAQGLASQSISQFQPTLDIYGHTNLWADKYYDYNFRRKSPTRQEGKTRKYINSRENL
jgi:hypothetical protein